MFVNNASLGVYATVVQSEAYRDAKIVHRGPDAARPARPEGSPGSTCVSLGPDGIPQRSADVVLVSNDAYRLAGSTGFGTRARIDTGVLGVVTVTVDRGGDVAALIAARGRGRVDRFRGYQEWTTPEFIVDSGEPLVDVGVDGEALRLEPPLLFRSLPGVLRVRAPGQRAGASPAAMAPAGPVEAVAGVLRVLGGRSARAKSHETRGV